MFLRTKECDFGLRFERLKRRTGRGDVIGIDWGACVCWEPLSTVQLKPPLDPPLGSHNPNTSTEVPNGRNISDNTEDTRALGRTSEDERRRIPAARSEGRSLIRPESEARCSNQCLPRPGVGYSTSCIVQAGERRLHGAGDGPHITLGVG